MKTLVLKVDAACPDAEVMRKAGEAIRRGELVAFPTETVYGLAADSFNEAAVRRVFDVKGRPADNPLPVQVASLDDACELAEVTEVARKLMSAFSPGPLTLVMRAKEGVSELITAGTGKVGIRIPDHPVALALIQAAGRPIVAPSANTSGEPPPTSAEEVLAYLDGKIELILDAEHTDLKTPSTVVDVTGTVPRIIRQGSITSEMIASAL